MNDLLSSLMFIAPYIIGFFSFFPIETVVRNFSNKDYQLNIWKIHLTFNFRFYISLLLCLLAAIAFNIGDISKMGLLDSKGQIALLWAIIFGESQYSFYTLWKNTNLRAAMQPKPAEVVSTP